MQSTAVDDAEQLAIIVLDNGSGTIKAGFAGEDAPRTELPTLGGQARHPGVNGAMLGIDTDNFVGEDAQRFRGLLKAAPPIVRGRVTDWDAIQHLWYGTFTTALQVAVEEHPVLLTETPDNSRSDREKMISMMFEVFNSPAVVIANTATLSLFSTGRSSGIIVDSGYGRTHIGPVWEGYVMPHFLRRMDIAGSDLTVHLQGKLRMDGYPFSTIADLERVNQIKEELCYVSSNITAELNYCQESKSLERLFSLPDGQQVYMNEHRFTVAEAMFDPSLLGGVGESFNKDGTSAGTYPGIHEIIHDTINLCDKQIQQELYSGIVLAGGNTLFNKFDERVQAEVAKMAPKKTTVRAVAFPDRKYATWTGGSVLGSLSTFPCMWVSKNEFDDYGPSIVHRKC